MNRALKFRAVYLNGLFIRMFIVSIVLSLFMFTALDIDYSFIYLFSMIIVFIGVLSVFYLNRKDVEFIEIKDSTVEIHYFNKSFFKKDSLIVLKESLYIRRDENIITLLKDDNIIGLIRKNSLISNSWEEIKIALVE
ncbi:hypothetical protein [Alkalitalea saponilacus]|uniref:Uncharacterized protein n=1 Tax=Alkalitalea saponilacus TaxID=889453 RepID=A0A1T5AP27_9BACT|nr:hypothetical protein [Alkalitalea saponilacus]ASB48637.1 hypothetical protein CDL62_05520 [Alkalitalea saponilacus]SKB36752.1 hypothetical protein SAMN03080601_00336 [Alkalitalea saponilacus]